MRMPLKISFHGLSRSDTLEEIIRENVTKLEKTCDYMVSCTVGIKRDQKRRQTANPFRIRIEMRVPPNHNLVITHESGLKEFAEDLPVAINNAFKTARRQLRKLVEKQRGEVKSHPEQEPVAFVEKLFKKKDYGFLRTIEGDAIYFHRNSVHRDQFDELEIGTGVQYTAEMGREGLQASSVRIIDKPGARQSKEEK